MNLKKNVFRDKNLKCCLGQHKRGEFKAIICLIMIVLVLVSSDCYLIEFLVKIRNQVHSMFHKFSYSVGGVASMSR